MVASSSSNRPAVICLSSSSATARSRCAGGRVRGTPGLNRADARTAAGTESPHEHSSYARPVCQSCGGGEGVNAGPGWAAGRGGHARDRRWRWARGAKHVSKKKSARPLVLARSRPPNPPRPRPPGPGRLGCSFDRPLGGGQAGLGCGDGHRGRGEAGRGAGDGRPGAPLCLPFFLRPPRRRAPPARAPPPLQLAPMGKLAPSVMASERDTAQLRHTRSPPPQSAEGNHSGCDRWKRIKASSAAANSENGSGRGRERGPGRERGRSPTRQLRRVASRVPDLDAVGIFILRNGVHGADEAHRPGGFQQAALQRIDMG